MTHVTSGAATVEKPARAGGRRTQAERVAETRTRLLDATVDCLAEIGYARMTTADVAARAGMSRGAQLYHFDSKAELVASAVDHLLDRMHAQFTDAVGDLPAGADRAPAAVDILWQLVRGATFSAFLELVTAGRTNAELAPRVAGVANHFAGRVAMTFFQLFPPPDGMPTPEHAAAAPMLISVFIGLATLRQVEGGPDFSESLLPIVKGIAPQFLPAPAEAP